MKEFFFIFYSGWSFVKHVSEVLRILPRPSLGRGAMDAFRKLQDAGNAVYRYSARFGQAVSETGSLIFGWRDN
jgi:hypothetical protein